MCGNRWCGSVILALADLRCLVGTREKDAAAIRQPQWVVDLIEDRDSSPEVRVSILLVGNRLQRVAVRDEMGSPGVDRARGRVLGSLGVGDLLQADVGRGPQRVSGPTEHRVLDVDLLEVELPVAKLAVATPEEDERRRLVLLAAHRHPARRAPSEELVDLLGHVTNGALPIVEEDLHADGLRLASQVLGLCSRLVLLVRWGLPPCTL